LLIESNEPAALVLASPVSTTIRFLDTPPVADSEDPVPVAVAILPVSASNDATAAREDECALPDVASAAVVRVLTITGAVAVVTAVQEVTAVPEVPTAAAALMDGTALAEASLEATRKAVVAWIFNGHAQPRLVVMVAGANAASASYIRRKRAAAVACGVGVEV